MTQTLHGNLSQQGFVVSWSEGQSFHPDDGGERLEILLNVEGHGELRSGRRRETLAPRRAAHCVREDGQVTHARTPGGRHAFLTAAFSRDYAGARLGLGSAAQLHPAVRGFLEGRRVRTAPFAVGPLTLALEGAVRDMRDVPVADAALGLWWEARMLDLMSRLLYAPPGRELFCEAHKRRVRENVNRVKELVLARLEEPPGLTELADAVGWNPFFLCRTFGREEGVSLSRFVRRARVERAAALMRTDGMNVTEAAMAVGYSSLSHFSKAFAQDMGCCPCTWRLRGAAR
jgi:AraC-like DNA-binding protein